MITKTTDSLQTSTLYFFYSNHCDHCHEAAPHLNVYQREHGYRILIVRLNLDFHNWHIDSWTPRSTPAYALVENGQVKKKHEGLLNAAGLTAWLKGAT